MIAHVSMPADDCRLVATTLADWMGGTALPFPPGGPNAWNAWSADEQLQIVVTPRGQYIVAGPTEQTWAARETPDRASDTHFALHVSRPAMQILAAAELLGWPARICQRGDFFHALEVWVERAYLVEIIDPTFTIAYRRNMTIANWRAHFPAGESSR